MAVEAPPILSSLLLSAKISLGYQVFLLSTMMGHTLSDCIQRDLSTLSDTPNKSTLKRRNILQYTADKKQ